MKREGVLITTLKIDRKLQTKLFQIKIPREVKNIIGVEMGVRMTSGMVTVNQPLEQWTLPMRFIRNTVVGEMKLQSYERANIFYAGELTLNNNNEHADFSSKHFSPKVYTHQYASNEDVSVIDGKTTILQGVYKDKLANHLEQPYSYSVDIYVWYEVKEDQTNI